MTLRQVLALPMALMAALWLASRLGGWTFARAGWRHCWRWRAVLLGGRRAGLAGGRGPAGAGRGRLAGGRAGLPLDCGPPAAAAAGLLDAQPISEARLAPARRASRSSPGSLPTGA
jgi:hypothetical protein